MSTEVEVLSEHRVRMIFRECVFNNFKRRIRFVDMYGVPSGFAVSTLESNRVSISEMLLQLPTVFGQRGGSLEDAFVRLDGSPWTTRQIVTYDLFAMGAALGYAGSPSPSWWMIKRSKIEADLAKTRT